MLKSQMKIMYDEDGNRLTFAAASSASFFFRSNCSTLSGCLLSQPYLLFLLICGGIGNCTMSDAEGGGGGKSLGGGGGADESGGGGGTLTSGGGGGGEETLTIGDARSTRFPLIVWPFMLEIVKG